MTPALRLFFSCFALIACTRQVAGAEVESPAYSEHQDLSYFLNADGSRGPIRTPQDWQQRRQHILSGMEQAMGALPRPQRPVPLDVVVVEEAIGVVEH